VFKQFLNHIDQFKLFTPHDSVLLAVSGGIDSMVMLHLFKEAKFKIGVAHCNFQLRGKASDEDELFVQQVCSALDIPFFSQRFETESFAESSGLSIQMAARDLRYSWFGDVVSAQLYSLLATAHHLDDSIETVLLNMTKGTATEGLAGIPVRNGNIIRPLLYATREQIAAYAHEKGIRWREDESNVTDDYQRNFIRHKVMPKLKELNPSLAITWQHGMEKIRGDLELLYAAHDNWKQKFIQEKTDRIVIDKNAFERFEAAPSILWRYIKMYGFNFEQSREIIQTLHGQSGKRFISPTHLLVVDREALIITPNAQELADVKIDKAHHEANLSHWKLHLSYGTVRQFGRDKWDVSLDADRLTYPLVWRKWKNGDAFQPLGMNHKKKLSDFFIDNKLSLVDKNTITVLESAGEVIYVVGWRIDHRFRITDHTKNVLHIHVQSTFGDDKFYFQNRV
jgi:tRNA(Ile)-lysidine synthase